MVEVLICFHSLAAWHLSFEGTLPARNSKMLPNISVPWRIWTASEIVRANPCPPVAWQSGCGCGMVGGLCTCMYYHICILYELYKHICKTILPYFARYALPFFAEYAVFSRLLVMDTAWCPSPWQQYWGLNALASGLQVTCLFKWLGDPQCCHSGHLRHDLWMEFWFLTGFQLYFHYIWYMIHLSLTIWLWLAMIELS